MAASGVSRPPDKPIAGAEVPRGRPPRDTRQRAAGAPHQILQVRADRLLIPEIVVLREEAVEEPLVGRPADLADLQRAQVAQRGHERARVHAHRRRAGARAPRLGRAPAGRGQGEVPGAVQAQEQATTDRITRLPVRLRPLPGGADGEGQGAPAEVRLRREQRPQQAGTSRSSPTIAPRSPIDVPRSSLNASTQPGCTTPESRPKYSLRHRRLNVAVTFLPAFIVTVHVPVPVQAPPHPWNLAFLFGVAVSVTTLPAA